MFIKMSAACKKFFFIEDVATMSDLAELLSTRYGFLHDFLAKELKTKPYGMCVVSSWSNVPVDQFGLYVVSADLQQLDQDLQQRGALSCNLDNYRCQAKTLLEPPCKKSFRNAAGVVENMHPFSLPGSAIMGTGKGNFVIFPLDEAAFPTVLDFIASATIHEKHNFWKNVSLAITESIKSGEPFQFTIHIGPCYQQGNPVFHCKVGPKVGTCVTGEHFKLQCVGHKGQEEDKFNVP